MNNTVATTKRMSVKMKRLLCQHANVIELADGVQVCTGCSAVLPASTCKRVMAQMPADPEARSAFYRKFGVGEAVSK